MSSPSGNLSIAADEARQCQGAPVPETAAGTPARRRGGPGDGAPGAAQGPLERTFDRCCAGLYRYAVVRLGDAHTADDAMQQLWLQASTSDRFVPDGELEYWLRGILTNLIRSHWRRQKRRPPHVPLTRPGLAAELAERIDREPLPPEWLERREVRDQLLLAITELGSDEQELIVQHYFHGRAHAQLAAERGSSVRAIEGRLYRARQALQHKLKHLA